MTCLSFQSKRFSFSPLIAVALLFGVSVFGPIAGAQQTKITHPLQRFEGQWVVDTKGFSMVWDTQTLQTIPLTGQVSSCKILNTPDALLCEVDTPHDPNANSGNITWVWNRTSGQVKWLSHFTPARYGKGVGHVDEIGNLIFRVEFSDEPQNTYREYRWTWLQDGSYELMSRQFEQDGKQTGNWYGGRFVRAKAAQDGD